MASIGTESSFFTRFEGGTLSWRHWVENITCATLDWGYSVTVIRSGEGYEANRTDSCPALLYCWLNPLTYLGLIIRYFSSEHAEFYNRWQASLTSPSNTPLIVLPRQEEIVKENPSATRVDWNYYQGKFSQLENPAEQAVNRSYYQEKFSQLENLAEQATEIMNQGKTILLEMAPGFIANPYYLNRIIQHIPVASPKNAIGDSRNSNFRLLLRNSFSALIKEGSMNLKEISENHDSMIKFLTLCQLLSLSLDKDKFLLLNDVSDSINKCENLTYRNYAIQGFLTLALRHHSQSPTTAKIVAGIIPQYLKMALDGQSQKKLRESMSSLYATFLSREDYPKWGQVFTETSVEEGMKASNAEMRQWFLLNFPVSWDFATEKEIEEIFSNEIEAIIPYFIQGMQNKTWCERIMTDYSSQAEEIVQTNASLPAIVLIKTVGYEGLPSYLMSKPERTAAFYESVVKHLDENNEIQSVYNCFNELTKENKLEAFRGILKGLNDILSDEKNVSKSLNIIIKNKSLIELVAKLSSENREELFKEHEEESNFTSAYLTYACASDPNNLSSKLIDQIVSSNGLPYLFAMSDKILLEQLKNELQNNIQLLANNQVRKSVNMDSINELMLLGDKLKDNEPLYALYMEICGEKILECKERINENRTVQGTFLDLS